MSRDFSPSGKYLSKSGAVASSLPCSFACWIKLNVLDWAIPFKLQDSGASNSFATYFDPTGHWNVESKQSGGNSTATTSATIAAGAWTHAAAVFASSTSRSAYLAGANKVSNGSSSTPSGLSLSYIGGDPAGDYTNGQIAFPAFWAAALSDADIASLAAGASPLLVQPSKLAAYIPLLGNSPENDLVSATGWTLTGAPPVAANPRIFLP
jgi:hypothetical protein